MNRRSLSEYGEQIRTKLQSAFREEHTSHEVAGSFSIGLFVVVLPSMGLGLLLFLFLTRLSERISPIAIFSTGLVINPLVKAPMYIAAFWIGTRFFGPVRGTAGGSSADAIAVAIRMVSGFVVLGIVLAAVGYVVVYVLVTEYRKREIEIVEEIVDDDLLAE